MDLTPRQKSIVTAIRTFTEDKGFAPAQRDLANRTGVAVSDVNKELGRLCEMGVVAREPNTARSVRVIVDQPQLGANS